MNLNQAKMSIDNGHGGGSKNHDKDEKESANSEHNEIFKQKENATARRKNRKGCCMKKALNIVR